MDTQKVWWCIAGSAVLTYLLRFLPLEVLATRQLPRPVVVWLRFVPSGVIAAIFLQWLCVPETAAGLSITQKLYLAVSLPMFWVAWRTRNFLYTVVCGCGMTAISRLCLAHFGVA
jgi:branched-subunit amino acid transport protein